MTDRSVVAGLPTLAGAAGRARARPLLVAALAALSACGDARARPAPERVPPRARAVAAPPAAAGAALSFTLADSVPYADELYSGHLRRVVAIAGGRRDTLPGVLVESAGDVRAVGDTALVGVRHDGGYVGGLFVFDARTRTTRLLPPPPDLAPTEPPSLSPDGRHLAYVAYEGHAEGDGSYAAVAEVPGGRLVWDGPRVAGSETDAGIGRAWWDGDDRFTVLIDLAAAGAGAHRVRGTLRPIAARIDTVPSSHAR